MKLINTEMVTIGYDLIIHQSNSAEAARNRNKIHHPTMQCSLQMELFFIPIEDSTNHHNPET